MIFYCNTLICGQLTTLPLMLQQSSLPTCRPPLSAPKPHIPLPHSSHHTSHFLIPTLGSTRHSRTPLSPLTTLPIFTLCLSAKNCQELATTGSPYGYGLHRRQQAKEHGQQVTSEVNKPKNRSAGHPQTSTNQRTGHQVTSLSTSQRTGQQVTLRHH